MKKVHLAEFADKKIYELSGGMKQRVSIARALINNPEICMQNLMRGIWQDSGKTIFFITHDVEEALLLATRIIVLSSHPGRIIDDIPVNFSAQMIDTGDDVKFTPEFYKYREKLLKSVSA